MGVFITPIFKNYPHLSVPIRDDLFSSASICGKIYHVNAPYCRLTLRKSTGIFAAQHSTTKASTMRARLSSDPLQSNRLDYDAVRLDIKNGDVLMYKGRSFSSRIIQFVTRSKYSHAGLAAWWKDRLMVLEAVGNGVVVTRLSANVVHYKGNVELFTSNEDIPEEDRLRMVHFAQEELGKQYALWSTILLGIRLLFVSDKETRDTLKREKRLFCSHYVAQTYNVIHRDLKKGVSDRFMSPGDVANSPLLRKVGILHKGLFREKPRQLPKG